MSQRSRRSLDLPLLQPFISLDWFAVPAQSSVCISSMDMEDETVVVTHVVGNEPLSLRGYSLCDFHECNWFRFPDDFVLDPGQSVTIYCCPGKRARGSVYRAPYVLWTNKDGSLRQRNVLNNGRPSALRFSLTFYFCSFICS
jgi:hypothetical protein